MQCDDDNDSYTVMMTSICSQYNDSFDDTYDDNDRNNDM